MMHDAGYRPVSKYNSAATVILAVVLPFLCMSCSGHGKQLGEAVMNRDSTSVMTTVDVDMLISENGSVRYHVTAPEWMVFDSLEPPRYSLEKGVFLEIFDSIMQVESTLEADTAYYFTRTELWQLKGNVKARNVKGDRFDTQELFINNSNNRIYSDSAISVRQPERILNGVGFESNGNMTEYFIRHSSGVFPIRDIGPDTVSVLPDSVAAGPDSIAANTDGPDVRAEYPDVLILSDSDGPRDSFQPVSFYE